MGMRQVIFPVVAEGPPPRPPESRRWYPQSRGAWVVFGPGRPSSPSAPHAPCGWVSGQATGHRDQRPGIGCPPVEHERERETLPPDPPNRGGGITSRVGPGWWSGLVG